MIVIGFAAGLADAGAGGTVDESCVECSGIFGSEEMRCVAKIVVLQSQFVRNPHHQGPRLRMKMIHESASQQIAKPAVAGQTTILASW